MIGFTHSFNTIHITPPLQLWRFVHYLVIFNQISIILFLKPQYEDHILVIFSNIRHSNTTLRISKNMYSFFNIKKGIQHWMPFTLTMNQLLIRLNIHRNTFSLKPDDYQWNLGSRYRWWHCDCGYLLIL